MKTAQLHHLLFAQEPGGHLARLIKADQVGRQVQSLGGAPCAESTGTRQKPEVRLVGTGADYCDLEVVCGCGETTRFRCWSTPGAGEKETA